MTNDAVYAIHMFSTVGCVIHRPYGMIVPEAFESFREPLDGIEILIEI